MDAAGTGMRRRLLRRGHVAQERSVPVDRRGQGKRCSATMDSSGSETPQTLHSTILSRLGIREDHASSPASGLLTGGHPWKKDLDSQGVQRLQ